MSLLNPQNPDPEQNHPALRDARMRDAARAGATGFQLTPEQLAEARSGLAARGQLRPGEGMGGSYVLPNQVKMVTRCPVHGQGHTVFACDHCQEQDPVRPVGIYYMPDKFYLCSWCYTKYTMARLDLAYALKTRCWECIFAEVRRLEAIRPDLYHDLTPKSER